MMMMAGKRWGKVTTRQLQDKDKATEMPRKLDMKPGQAT
jgi:hypothetical protein